MRKRGKQLSTILDSSDRSEVLKRKNVSKKAKVQSLSELMWSHFRIPKTKTLFSSRKVSNRNGGLRGTVQAAEQKTVLKQVVKTNV